MSKGPQNSEDKLVAATRPMQVLWIDDMMKTGDPGPFGMKHFFVIVDELTDYCWGIPSKDKEANGEFMYEFLKFLRKHNPLDNFDNDRRIEHIRTDGDGIFNSSEWNEVLEIFHIVPHISPAHEHWLQGKVEIKIRYLREAANTIRHQHGAPKILQLFALRFALRANNVTVHRDRKQTPHEVMFGEKPDLRFDYVPFSMVYLLTRSKDKELPKARVGCFIGYSETSSRRRTYQCLYISDTGRIIILKSVYRPRFIETYGFSRYIPSSSTKI
jgi:hypothetical protein